MNIFIIDHDPVIAAMQLCDKHVVKMIVESAQLLCSAFPSGSSPYRLTHYNHPCGKWARASKANYEWLLVHANAMCEEYTRRYGRTHKTEDVIVWCMENYIQLCLPDIGLTPHARAIREPWKTQTANDDIVTAYRKFYIGAKSSFAKWKHSECPGWFMQ